MRAEIQKNVDAIDKSLALLRERMGGGKRPSTAWKSSTP